jgi:hypothetical protein
LSPRGLKPSHLIIYGHSFGICRAVWGKGEYGPTYGETDVYTEIHMNGPLDGQTDRWTDEQTDRQTD